YGRVARHKGGNGSSLVDIDELGRYYRGRKDERRSKWQDKMPEATNWALSFEHCRESETTKHVHRLHPYKGKFIPQLAEYFLDRHTDRFKKKAIFAKEDLLLDPFCGSGTTLVQAAELGLHAIGVDVSPFNAFIANIKTGRFSIPAVERASNRILHKLTSASCHQETFQFDAELAQALSAFNREFFPSPEFKKKARSGEMDEKEYGQQKQRMFMRTYRKIVARHNIDLEFSATDTFIGKWFMPPLKEEIELAKREIDQQPDAAIRDLLKLILSRTVRSCRATTHSNLATLDQPVNYPYYCNKHGKICRPVLSIISWWKRYAADTIARLVEFDRLRSASHQACLAADSRTADLAALTKGAHPQLHRLLKDKKVRGIFSSPPYVGMIDYHEQHSYAYELFDFPRYDCDEIGPLAHGKGLAARTRYVEAIAAVLQNCQRFMVADCDVLLVANDQFGLYRQIAERVQMKIVQEHIRPVLNRSERDQGAYSETIFHLKRS
ncbi:MAG: DNA methyltransferase, partial [Betaproteobacteria bacterium]|nr:DNA methyltransferase [Betaproteobacteria bacterium]